MANFNTHLAVASVGSGLCATVALAGHAAPNNYLLTLTMAGTIGGILPDIDLERAVPARMLFSVLGIVTAFIALFTLQEQHSIAELWIVWLGAYAVTRFGLYKAFEKRTHHRGIFHSILAGLFFMTLTADIFQRVLGQPSAQAWLTGLFLFIGFIIHLVLDEIYSVDVEGRVIKKSFGTALKLYDSRSWRATAVMAAALVAVAVVSPPRQEFVEMVKPTVFFAFLKDRLLPKANNWFDMKTPGKTAALDDGQGQAH